MDETGLEVEFGAGALGERCGRRTALRQREAQQRLSFAQNFERERAFRAALPCRGIEGRRRRLEPRRIDDRPRLEMYRKAQLIGRGAPDGVDAEGERAAN